MRGLVVHTEKCAACGVCELTCALRHFKVNNPKKSMIRVEVHFSSEVLANIPKVCGVCPDPPCVKACPTGALRFNGRWIEVNEDKCTLCKMCAEACPNGSIFFHPEVKRPLICDLCLGDPECVKMCPMGALEYRGH
ncbi:MAG: 4Fe-4S dicluster domain-containing protein [Thermoprotei archaeon]|nr:MAG: 4Fe-4S dicluster domain-containing protein [Thermoprotei archaeon]RLF23145.1 MAG: 4Fe-4S dicluster domain-containing protein [Thermoprotei archaeon]